MEHDQESRITRIRAEALEMCLGNQKAAEHWLNTPQAILQDDTPIEHARTEQGANVVSALIIRVMSGTFS